MFRRTLLVFSLLFWAPFKWTPEASDAVPNYQQITVGKPSNKDFQNKTFGFLEILPLPVSYQTNYHPLERCFTGEIYSARPKDPLSSSGLVFIPNDYKEIIGASFLQTLREKNLRVASYSSTDAAATAAVDLLVAIAPTRFAVVNDRRLAQVNVFYRVINPRSGQLFWEGTIKKEWGTNGLPASLDSKGLVFMVGAHSLNFQPERSVLAFTMRQNVQELVSTLERIVKNE